MLKMLVLKMVKKYVNTNWVFLAGMTQNKQEPLKFNPYKCKSFVVYTFFTNNQKFKQSPRKSQFC